MRRKLRFFTVPFKKRTFGATHLDEIFTWVDASYAVHHDMNSHTGGSMPMGLGITFGSHSNKTFNTKSSTEPELVGASDYVTYNIWYIMFMHNQECLHKSNEISEQPKRHEDEDEWEKLFYWQPTPCRYHIFLHKVSGGKRRDQHHVLSNASHDSELLHKTTVGIFFS